MHIEPFVVKFVGDFELTDQVTLLVINTIDALMASYLIEKIGEYLDTIDLDMKFMEEESEPISNSEYVRRNPNRDLLPNTTALVEISGSIDIEGVSEEELAEWNEQQMTSVVMSFFSGVELEKLFTALRDKGMSLEEIAMHDGTTDSIVADEGVTTQSTNEGGQSDDGGSSKNMTALIAALVCGGFVFVTLGAALYMNNRRQRRKFRVADEMRSMSDHDSLNLRSGNDDLPDCNASGSHGSFPGLDVSESHVSFPHLLGDPDEKDAAAIDSEKMDDDTLMAIRSEKIKRRSKRDDFKGTSSFTSISIGSDDRAKKKAKKRKKKERVQASMPHAFQMGNLPMWTGTKKQRST